MKYSTAGRHNPALETNSPRLSRPWVGRYSACCAASALAVFLSACSWTELATRNSNDEQADHDSFRPDVSEDGQFVAYQSIADNLVAGDSNGAQDVFVRDMAESTTSRASVSSGQAQANAGSYVPAISGDGRFVAFASDATNLVSGDSNGVRDVFLRDRDSDTTQRISAFGFPPLPVTEGNGPSENVDLWCLGFCVAVFESDASNLVSNDTNGRRDIFRWQSGGLERLSVDKDGEDADGDSANPSLSAAGSLVAFDSSATNLLPFGSDTNGFRDVYVRNTAQDENSLVSAAWLGGFANGSSENPAISDDGRYVAFESQASDLVFLDDNTGTAIYVRDRINLFTQKMSVNNAGESANGVSLSPAISGNGRYVAFWSDADNLVPDDTNNRRDIFVRDRWTNTTSRVSVNAFGEQSNALSDDPALSGDGRYVVFTTAADNLVKGDDNDINIGPGFFRSAFDIVIRVTADVAVHGIDPSVLPVGTTTSVTITGDNFFAGTTVDISGNDETTANLVVVDENTITVDITPAPGAATGERNVSVLVPGTGPGTGKGNLGLCAGCAIYE